MAARKSGKDEKPQRERFIETAHRIGASENEDTFEGVFRKIVPPRTVATQTDKPIKPAASRSRRTE